MMLFKNEAQAKDFLNAIGTTFLDKDIDILNASLAFSYLERPDENLQDFHEQIQLFQDALAETYNLLCGHRNSDSVFVQAEALKDTLHNYLQFTGDENDYDNLDNINLFSVMKKRQGLPISLCIIAIHLCRHMGWNAHGVNFPGHFIMIIEKDGERVLLDPFQNCMILEAKDLRLILKRVMGEYAELSADYYAACTNRDLLLRFQNNVKYRYIDAQRYDDALTMVDRMILVAPDDYRLDLDKAVLYARVEQPQAAITHIKKYIANVPDDYERMEAEKFLAQLKSQLN